MTRVFEELENRDLLNIRSVNCFWNEIACFVLNQRSNEEERRDAFITTNSQMEAFLAMLKGRKAHFPTVHFNSFLLSLTEFPDEQIREFTELIGDEIREFRMNPEETSVAPEVYVGKLATFFTTAVSTNLEKMEFYRNWPLVIGPEIDPASVPRLFPNLNSLWVTGFRDIRLDNTLIRFVVERAPLLKDITLSSRDSSNQMNIDLVYSQLPQFLNAA